jgi:hypothetical protein
MAISTFEGVVKDGHIRLRDDVRLPENTQVYVVIPDLESSPRARVPSPRLVHPQQAPDFVKQVVEAVDDAEL